MKTDGISIRPGRRVIRMKNPGKFVKDFPRIPGSPPCGEKYVTPIQGCPFDCTYCYLRSYLGHGDIVIFTNTGDMAAEITEALAEPGLSRITTGEMSDSLALDHLTGTVLEILPLFAGSGVILEIRTKSSRVGHIIDALEKQRGPAPDGRDGETRLHPDLVITWTLSPREAISAEERGAASLGRRLEAMSRTAAAGIRVGVRLDPVIPAYYSPEAYRELVSEIAEHVDVAMLQRFELGVLRFVPGLWETVREGDPGSALLKGEYITDREGKTRLYRPQRIMIYREISSIVRSFFGPVPIELSMEDREVWEDAGLDPDVNTPASV